jgi:multidrug efflux pump subunit AcrB
VSNLDTASTSNTTDEPKGFFIGIVSGFLTGKNALLLLLLSLALGTAAIFGTPREEEPQIVVPLADVFVSAPGYSADEIERLVATPMERLLWQLDGVEYVYSSSMRDQAVITVRFYVGQDREDSLVKLQTRIQQNMDRVPPMVENWVIKPIEIDDVPIVMLALYGEGYDEYALRRIGEEMQSRFDLLPELSGTELAGGSPRLVRVEVDRERLQGRGISLGQVVQSIQRADTSTRVGAYDENDANISVSVGDGFHSTAHLENLVLAAPEGRIVRLRDVAEVIDGPAEPESYSYFAWRCR